MKPGDQRFEDVLRTHGPALRRLVAAWERDPAAREDLVQEIHIALWRALPSFRGDCSERAFVFRVATNRTLTHRFKRRAEHQTLDESAPIADPRPTPELEVAATQRLEQLRAALQRIAGPERQILTLALEGLPRAEIAEVLGITENHAGVRLSRARRKLREEMEKA